MTKSYVQVRAGVGAGAEAEVRSGCQEWMLGVQGYEDMFE